MLLRALALLVPALSLLACGGDDAPPAGTTTAGFCLAVSERVCAGLDACACRFDLRPYDAAGCVAARAAACTEALDGRIGPDLAAGRARFDEPSVTACLAAIGAMADRCELAHDGSGPLPAACDAFVLATAAIGEACQLTGGGLAFCGATADGVCAPGEAGQMIDSGATTLGGRIPVNMSGGLLSKGHPLGATGIANIYEVVTHLRGEAGARQVEGARIGLTHVVGGAQHWGSACAIHILERTQ